MNTQYSKAIDAIIYSEATKDFTKEEWLTLSNVAQDQAGGEMMLAAAELRFAAKIIQDHVTQNKYAQTALLVETHRDSLFHLRDKLHCVADSLKKEESETY